MSQTLYPAIPHFKGGLVSKRAQGNVAFPLHNYSLSQCANWIVSPQGSLSTRFSTKWRENTGHTAVRTFPFRIAGKEDYIVEVTDTTLRVLDNNGTFLDTSQTDLLFNRLFLEGFNGWQKVRYNRTAGIYDNKIGSGGPSYAHHRIIESGWQGKHVVYLGNAYDSVVGQIVTVAAGEELEPHTLKVFVSQVINTGPAVSNISDAYGVRMRISTVAGTVLFTSDSFGVGQKTFNFTPGAGNTSFRVRIETRGDTSHPAYRDDPTKTIPIWVHFKNISLTNDLDTGGNLLSFSGSPFTEEQLPSVQSDYDSGLRQIWFVHPDVHPCLIKQDIATGVWSFDATPTFINPPVDWGADNYPALIRFHEGRAIFARTEDQKSEIWGSKSNDPLTLAPGSPSTADDGWNFVVKNNGMIQFLESHKELIIGTTSGDIILTSSGGLVTYNDFNFSRQNSIPSRFGVSTVAANVVVYASRDGKKVRFSRFDGDATESWKSNDLTLWADIFEDMGAVKRLVYIDDPHYALIVLTEHSELVWGTFIPNSDEIAWTPIFLHEGYPIDITAMNDNSGTYIWISVLFGDEVQYWSMRLTKELYHLDCAVETEVNFAGKVRGLRALRAAEGDINYIMDYGSSPLNEQGSGPIANDGELDTVTIASGGTGYTIGDTLRLSGGTTSGWLKVASVASGVIDSVFVLIRGTGYAETDTGLTVISGGTGTGATFDVNEIDWYVDTGDAANAGRATIAGLSPNESTEPVFTTIDPNNWEVGGGSSITSAIRWNSVTLKLIDSALPLIEGNRVQRNEEDIAPTSGVNEDYLVTGIGEYTIRMEGYEEGKITVKQDLPYHTEISGIFGKVSVDNL